ncbi:MAG: VanZ family protein [Bacteroidota bacterium]
MKWEHNLSRATVHFFKYKLPAILWALLIFIGSSIPASKLPKIPPYVSDKLIHTVLYCIFGLLFYLALEPKKAPENFQWKRLMLMLLVVMVYGGIDEFHQHFVPGRTMDMYDFIADTVGGLIAVLFIVKSYWSNRVKSS